MEPGRDPDTASQPPSAEERLRRIFALSRDLFCIAGADGFFRDVNPAWEEQFGWSLDELRGRPFFDFIHPDDQAPTAAQYEAQKAGGHAISFSNRYRRKDGTYRWLEWNATPVGADGLIYAVARDVTERRDAEERVRALNAQLEHHLLAVRALNAELEAYSYSVSHDLRAPVRHIAGFADLLQKHAAGTLDEKGRRYLETIRSAAGRMGDLIDDLLAFSRVGRAELRADRVPLDEVVASVLAELKEEIDERSVGLEVRPLPVVRGDASLLRMVMVNLVSNALKYTRPKPEARIEIGATDGQPGYAVVFVRDNGVGFDMKYADKLFGVFQRLHSADEFEGTGIGLASVQRIVHRHGGRVSAEGRPGEGATFYVALPPAAPGRPT
jgi:PAS domain S-box-containing protein